MVKESGPQLVHIHVRTVQCIYVIVRTQCTLPVHCFKYLVASPHYVKLSRGWCYSVTYMYVMGYSDILPSCQGSKIHVHVFEK